MRIQEHLFQGFFGIKKKEDVEKYYDKRVKKLKGIDEHLDRCIANLKKILLNHEKKLATFNAFIQKPSKKTLESLRKEIKRLEGMFDEDELANEEEKRYALKILESIEEMHSNEDSSELNALEREVLYDLGQFRAILEEIGPVWGEQLQFIDQEERIILQPKQIQQIVSIFKKESEILRIQEELLRKIDLHTGSMLRKASLKLQDVEETTDMGMQYRNIKHIR